jgi:hypothetical protein
MMGIEAPLGAVHLGARAQHRPIEVDREPGEAAALDLLIDQVADQGTEPLEQGRGEDLEPAHHGAVRRHEVEPRKAQQDRIRANKRQVRHAQAPDHEEPDQQQDDPDRTEVALEGVSRNRARRRPGRSIATR